MSAEYEVSIIVRGECIRNFKVNADGYMAAAKQALTVASVEVEVLGPGYPATKEMTFECKID